MILKMDLIHMNFPFDARFIKLTHVPYIYGLTHVPNEFSQFVSVENYLEILFIKSDRSIIEAFKVLIVESIYNI